MHLSKECGKWIRFSLKFVGLLMQALAISENLVISELIMFIYVVKLVCIMLHVPFDIVGSLNVFAWQLITTVQFLTFSLGFAENVLLFRVSVKIVWLKWFLCLQQPQRWTWNWNLIFILNENGWCYCSSLPQQVSTLKNPKSAAAENLSIRMASHTTVVRGADVEGELTKGLVSPNLFVLLEFIFRVSMSSKKKWSKTIFVYFHSFISTFFAYPIYVGRHYLLFVFVYM